MTTKLSAHFTWDEVTRSAQADALQLSNAPTETHRAAIAAVTAPGMEAVRKACGDRPITVTSWYRSPAVNRAVGGVKTSAHALGYAVDFRVGGLTPKGAAKWIIASGLKFDQLIWESGRGILHISFDPRLRGEVMTQPGGPGTKTYPGLVVR